MLLVAGGGVGGDGKNGGCGVAVPPNDVMAQEYGDLCDGL